MALSPQTTRTKTLVIHPYVPKFQDPSHTVEIIPRILKIFTLNEDDLFENSYSPLKTGHHQKKKDRKKVGFNSRISVILIPCRDEYFQEGLDEFLWYSKSELRTIEKGALVSLSLGKLDY